MDKVSIVIPSRNEQFLPRTIEEIFAKARGEFEVIAVLDGYWPEPQLENRPNLVIVHRGQPQGMRPCINDGVAVASGKYVMKLDAHCALDEGFDVKLQADCDKDWVVIPRRYSLDPDNWTPQKAPIDYMYLSFPDNPHDWGGKGYHGRKWDVKNRDESLKDVLLDDQMSFQGSSWFMHRDYFHFLELMDIERYGPFWQEAQEIGPKCWYSGGRVMRNKKTWYAHLHKGKRFGRGYFIGKSSIKSASEKTREFIENPDWAKQVRGLKSWVEYFWPIPGWPEDWEKQLEEAKGAFYTISA